MVLFMLVNPRRGTAAARRHAARRPAACYYCGAPLTPPYQLDHVIPHARGGPSTEGNLVPVCDLCNAEKWNDTITEWRMYRRTEGWCWPPRNPWPAMRELWRNASPAMIDATYAHMRWHHRCPMLTVHDKIVRRLHRGQPLEEHHRELITMMFTGHRVTECIEAERHRTR